MYKDKSILFNNFNKTFKNELNKNFQYLLITFKSWHTRQMILELSKIFNIVTEIIKYTIRLIEILSNMVCMALDKI